MATYTYPTHPPARGTVFMVSCMDLRLLDDIVRFMDYDNLTNRYDQFIVAGVGLGVERSETWRTAFFEHLTIACELHGVTEVYIIEHRHCGAYEKLLPKGEGTFNDSEEGQQLEFERHQHYAQQLTDLIQAWARDHSRTLRVQSFLMDLRGNVELLPGRSTGN